MGKEDLSCLISDLFVSLDLFLYVWNKLVCFVRELSLDGPLCLSTRRECITVIDKLDWTGWDVFNWVFQMQFIRPSII